MEWVPVVEKLTFPITMVLIMVTWFTAVGGFVGTALWRHFFVPVKDSLLDSLKENSDTNQAILQQVHEAKTLALDSKAKVDGVAERQSGFHDFLQKAGGYGILMGGANAAKENGDKLDRIEKKVDVVVEKLK